MSFPFLIDLQTSQVIAYIDKPVFRIGRDSKYCDLVIDDAPISRSHCNIISRGDGFYSILDCNSTNGTSVENTILKPIEEYPLQSRDCIRIGNKIFLFMTESDEV